MKKIKILIAEDDRISYEYLKEILRDEKAEIFLAKTGLEAVEICKNNADINIVFMDIKMPVMDGRKATKEIKKFRSDLPIIAQTAYALDDERETILHEGFDAYLAKPIQRKEVQTILEKYLY